MTVTVTRRSRGDSMKTFSDALIKRLNKICEHTPCRGECEGIGWCEKVWETEHDNADSIQDSRRDTGSDGR